MKVPSVGFLIPFFMLGMALAIFVVPAIDYYLSLDVRGRFGMACALSLLIGFPGLIAMSAYLDKKNLI